MTISFYAHHYNKKFLCVKNITEVSFNVCRISDRIEIGLNIPTISDCGDPPMERDVHSFVFNWDKLKKEDEDKILKFVEDRLYFKLNQLIANIDHIRFDFFCFAVFNETKEFINKEFNMNINY